MDNIITKYSGSLPHPADVKVPFELNLVEIGFLANAIAYLFARAAGNPMAEAHFGEPLRETMVLLGPAACADLNTRLGEVLTAQAAPYGDVERIPANPTAEQQDAQAAAMAAQAFGANTGKMVA